MTNLFLLTVYPIPQKKSIGEAKKFAEMGDDIVSELQKLFDEGVLAMREGNIAGNAVKAANKFVATDGATMYRVRNTENTDADKFVANVDRWDGKTIGFSFVVGETSEALQKAGVPKKQIRWDASKISTLLRKHNGMTIDIIKKIPTLLKNPIIVIDSKKDKILKLLWGICMIQTGKL